MEIYFVRHGEPNYELDALTENGKIQAEKTSKFLNKYDYDLFFSSPNGRARETASHLCSKKETTPIILPFLSEDTAFTHYGFHNEVHNNRRWVFYSPKGFNVLNELSLKYDWYNHDLFKDYKFKEAVEYYEKEVDKWLLTLGIKHNRENKTFIKIEGANVPNRVILFAHGGAAMAFFSSILDLPYSYVSTHFKHLELCGVSVLNINLEKQAISLNSYNQIYY